MGCGYAHHGDAGRELLVRIEQQSWIDFGGRNVIVSDGVAHLWGLVAEDGVARVSEEMFPAYGGLPVQPRPERCSIVISG
jgi:hypothetical protein